MEDIVNWLLEEDNPGVRLRALTGLCSYPPDHPQVQAARQLVLQTLPTAQDLSWIDGKGLQLVYNLTALAESGLSSSDLPLEAVVDRILDGTFDSACGDFILLRALVMLGYSADNRVQERLAQLTETQLPDGAWLCLHRLRKLKHIPKSCIKAAMHALLLAGELHKRGLDLPTTPRLLAYFLKRRLFYRTDRPDELVLDCRPGKRTTDVFFPNEVMRVGLPVLLEALAALGAGEAPELGQAWSLLEQKKDAQGRIRLEGTLSKSYLPKERVGKASKWASLYACLAWKNREAYANPSGAA
jgi:hypothetical protein